MDTQSKMILVSFMFLRAIEDKVAQVREQGLQSIGSMGALLPGRDPIARKVYHKQKINDFDIVL